jgi:hypothetical protein
MGPPAFVGLESGDHRRSAVIAHPFEMRDRLRANYGTGPESTPILMDPTWRS